MRFIDLTGKKYGRLTVINKNGRSKNGSILWLCECECGNETIVLAGHLKNGHTQSCGCYHNEQAKKCATHRMGNKPIYRVWSSLISRCTNKNVRNYKDYGGRGITVCDEWKYSFLTFYNDMITGYGKGLSIDRIDVDGNYSPSNCKWSTDKEQSNNRRTNKNITYNGETHNAKEWSEKLGLKYGMLIQHLNRDKWSIERALTTK